jgi:DNA topoisomerase-3
MKVVIAEKPSVAADIARVMGGTERKDGYILGNDMAFTWCFGHLLQLAPPEAYGFKGFSIESLPMIPGNFKLIPRLDKNGKPDNGILKQISIIESLFKKSSEIIVATDAGREGELIFRYLYSFLAIERPLKRLWLSSLTDKAIQDAFRALKPGSDYDSLFYSAKARSEADWLVGMNATQGLTIAVKSQKALSLGRVQTPTLAMVCSRYLENKNFIPENYYQVQLSLQKDSITFMVLSEKKFPTVESADTLVAAIMLTKNCFVIDYQKNEVKENPPLLFDLTSLQQEANKKFGLSADETLQTAQSLYESKFITYPRTGSRYISDDLVPGIPKLIDIQKKHSLFGAAATELFQKKLNHRSVNSSKVTDHHALLTTENFPSKLSEKEQNIYNLIAGRLLEAFNEPCIKDISKIIAEAATEKFIASGTVIKYPGWRTVWSIVPVFDNEQEDNQLLPEVAINEKMKLTKAENLQKKTKPKPIHNESSLLKAMETAGKDTADDEIKEAMKEKGIGTPATRASIIEILFKRNYIERQKKSLIPTPLGLMVYELVKDKRIASVDLTGAWEQQLNLIEKKTLLPSEFQEQIISYTKEVTQDVLQVSAEDKNNFNIKANANLVQCPVCKQGHVRIFEKAANCTRKNEGCDFVIFRTICSKKLTEKQITALVIKKSTDLIKGLKSKSGKSFDAILILDDQFKIQFKFSKK